MPRLDLFSAVADRADFETMLDLRDTWTAATTFSYFKFWRYFKCCFASH